MKTSHVLRDAQDECSRIQQDLEAAKHQVERVEADRREVKKLAHELVDRVKAEAET